MTPSKSNEISARIRMNLPMVFSCRKAHVRRPSHRMMVIKDVSSRQHEEQTHHAKKHSILNAARDIQSAKLSTLLHVSRGLPTKLSNPPHEDLGLQPGRDGPDRCNALVVR